MSKINRKRNERMQHLSIPELQRFCEAGSLSSAAAEYHLKKLGATPKRYVPAVVK